MIIYAISYISIAYINTVGERISMQEVNKFLYIGARINLLVMNSYNQSQYVSRVDNINEDGSIDVLIPISKRKIVYINNDTALKVIIASEGAIYEFKAEIVEKLFGVVPLLRLKRVSDIQKIQRRNYFRLKATNKFKIRKLINLKEAIYSEYFEVTMVDISGGGLAFNAEIELDINDLIEVNMDLNSKTINLLGKIVRADKDEDKAKMFSYGVNFEKIAEIERNVIMRYIFEEQRKLAKKGLI
jgi:c-di-GMP-binding flagellar brake protein YcgR